MILVTGGSGFIGSHLVERLCAQGESVRCFARRTSSWPAPVDVVYGDLVSGAGITDALRGVNTVIHLAGVTKALSADDYYAGNVRATENLVRAIAKKPVRLVHVSSLAAVGPSADRIPLAEETEPHPLTHYGKSKLEGERIVREVLPDAVIVRPPVVYGPRDTDVFQLLKSISRGLVLQIAGGERWFSAIYVRDLVDGILIAAQTPQAAGRSYFLAHPKVVSWTEFGAAAAAIMNRTPRVVNLPVTAALAAGFCAEAWSRLIRKPGIISREKIIEATGGNWICAPDRASRELGFNASTPIDQGLSNALAWYREAGWLTY